MYPDLGMIKPGSTLFVPFHTFDSNDPSASVTITGLATTDIEVYKDASMTQRASDSGYALVDTDGIDLDTITGIHGLTIDLSDNTTAGFWEAGSNYIVVISSITVDAATINFIAARFSIGYEGAMLNTSIATLSTQTSFTLSDGPAENDALNDMWCIIHDVASGVQVGKAIISDYVGSTKTVTLAAATTFTIAASDNIAIMGPMPLQPTTAGNNLGVASDGDISGNVDGNVVGSVASVTGAVGSVTADVGVNEWNGVALSTTNPLADIETDTQNIQSRLPAALVGGAMDCDVSAIQANAITAAAIATDAIGSDELAATAVNEIVDAVWDEDIADHVAAGTAGQAIELMAYSGPNGPGVYINDGAANTATVAGEDGTPSKPVSTFAAARTIADALGVKTYYLIGTDLALDATYEDWTFVGLGEVTSNIIDLGSQDVDRSIFHNLTIEGTQGGTQRIEAYNCALQDPGAGSTTLHIFAKNCGLVSDTGGVILSNNDDHVFDSCFSLVPGNAAPLIDFNSGANCDVNFRNYSGGLELTNVSATAVATIEGRGNIIFNASCSTSAVIAIRGMFSIVDNTGGMSALTETANINIANINAQVVDVMETDTQTLPGQEAPTATPTYKEILTYLYKNWRNKKEQTASTWSLYDDAGSTVDQKAAVSDDGTTSEPLIEASSTVSKSVIIAR